MGRDDSRARIVDQFSYQGERAPIWRVLDLLLPTEQFLNVGYSKWYQPHFVGSSQRRLAEQIATGIATRLRSTAEISLLDIGCGRGGPTLYFASEHGFKVTGIDLVPYNVSVAKRNAAEKDADAKFVVGDALHLPFGCSSFTVCTAVDSPPYVPNKRKFLIEMASVTSKNGLLVVSDFIRPQSLPREAHGAVDAFADIWDLAPIATLERYKRATAGSDFNLDAVVDITSNSIARFQKWTGLYLFLIRHGLLKPVERVLTQRSIDFDTLTKQVSITHPALPFLRHVVVYLRV